MNANHILNTESAYFLSILGFIMRNLLILLFGLLLLGLLGYVCIYQKHADSIQTDISNRANTLLHDIPQTAGATTALKAKVDGRDITLTGTVASEALKLKAEEVAKVHGYRTLDNQLSIVDLVEVEPVEVEPVQVKPKQPYRFTATKSPSKAVVLEGYVPTSEVQQQLLTLAKEKFGEEKVTDKLVVTPDAPEGWLSTVETTLSSLAVLDFGKVSLIDQKLEISGEAKSEEVLQKVKANVNDGITSNHQVSFDLIAPELPADVPVESTKESSSTGNNEEILAEKTKQEQQNLACQKQFEQLLAENTILFRTSSAIISTGSLSLLKQLVEVTQACSTQTISVEGHTDATGPRELNQLLSQLRAEAVVNYLVKKGIDKSRLKALGHGENNPIADNTSLQGRAANRRIEFIVKEVE